MGLVKYSHELDSHSTGLDPHLISFKKIAKINEKKIIKKFHYKLNSSKYTIMSPFLHPDIPNKCRYKLHVHTYIYIQVLFTLFFIQKETKKNQILLIIFHAFSSTVLLLLFIFIIFGLNLCVNLGPNDVIYIISLFGCVYIYILYMLDCVLVYTIVSS